MTEMVRNRSFNNVIMSHNIKIRLISPSCRHAEIYQTLSGVARLKSWAKETGELSENDLLISASVDEEG